MSTHTKGSGNTWVGRAIRRLEDPALVTGQGRFTADLPAAHWVRFARSAVASGVIRKITAPDGAAVITASDLKSVKPIRPMLHKFDYRPIGYPVLADGVVRFAGECVAAAIAPTEEEAEDIVDLIEIEIDQRPPLIDSRDAIAIRRLRTMSSSGGRSRPKASTRSGAARTRSSRSTPARAARTPRRWSRAAGMLHTIHPPGG
jgi:carbon-monoxide dehydrogenase large subunit